MSGEPQNEKRRDSDALNQSRQQIQHSSSNLDYLFTYSLFAPPNDSNPSAQQGQSIINAAPQLNMKKPSNEDIASWNHYVASSSQAREHRQQKQEEVVAEIDNVATAASSPSASGGHNNHQHRRLKHKTRSSKYSVVDAVALEREEEQEFWDRYEQQQDEEATMKVRQKKKHETTLKQLWANPGIDRDTVHGMMIDAGSTGSRMHVYEWTPRMLSNGQDVKDAVAGNKLSFPGTDSRWTDRLRPGLSSFATIENDAELQTAVAEYLQPLLDFARTVLHAKQHDFHQYPIFLRATAGMRILNAGDRARVMQVVRDVFSNKTYCPFAFVDEQARVLSGEEEAIYDWTGVNFLLGDLLTQSEGAGTVIKPQKTHGALDLGGGSTQISFYQPSEDIMSNLFKLQIGQAKHWNVYAHSFLFYGMNEAIHRFQARLSAPKTAHQRLVEGIYNPCLPRGTTTGIQRTNIHITRSGSETWNYTAGVYPSGDGSYQAIFQNDHNNKGGDNFEQCMKLTKDLLHLEKNDWCQFAHKGDCSLAGIYQPELPTQSETFREFVAFSNYYHIWKFLKLPERATIEQLYNATRHVCNMSKDEVIAYAGSNNKFGDDEDETLSYCFRSAYAFQLLHNGYGFHRNDTIRATKVINGHKVGWALGAMLYEINTMPWKYSSSSQPAQIPSSQQHSSSSEQGGGPAWDTVFLMMTGLVMLSGLVLIIGLRRANNDSLRRRIRDYEQYEPIKEVQV